MDKLNQIPQFFFFEALSKNPLLTFAIIIWSMAWKGFALWNASQQKQRNWFVAMLVLNTVGIFEIAYLFYFANKKLTIGNLSKYLKR